MMDNTCVCCGKIIPEGIQVCPGCNELSRDSLVETLLAVIRGYEVAQQFSAERYTADIERLQAENDELKRRLIENERR